MQPSNAKQINFTEAPGLAEILASTDIELKRKTLEYVNYMCSMFFAEVDGKVKEITENESGGVEDLFALYAELEPYAHSLTLQLWRIARHFKISQEEVAKHVDEKGVSESRFSMIVNNKGKKPKSDTGTRQLFRAIKAYHKCLNEKLKP